MVVFLNPQIPVLGSKCGSGVQAFVRLQRYSLSALGNAVVGPLVEATVYT